MKYIRRILGVINSYLFSGAVSLVLAALRISLKTAVIFFLSICFSSALLASNSVGCAENYGSDARYKSGFWLADTAWDAFYRLNNEQFSFYVKTRASQGFGLIMMQMIDANASEHTGGGLSINSAISDLKKGNFNLIRQIIEEIKEKISIANALGVDVALMPVWGRNISSGRIREEELVSLMEILSSEIQGLSVVWILGGDVNPDAYSRGIWVKALGVLRSKFGCKAKVIFHPNLGVSSEFFSSGELLYFSAAGVQGGHADPLPFSRNLGANFAKAKLLSNMPVIELESGYENIPIALPVSSGAVSYSRRIRSIEVMRRAILSVMIGYDGYTYGNYDVAKFWTLGMRERWPPHIFWRDALFTSVTMNISFVDKIYNYLRGDGSNELKYEVLVSDVDGVELKAKSCSVANGRCVMFQWERRLPSRSFDNIISGTIYKICQKSYKITDEYIGRDFLVNLGYCADGDSNEFSVIFQ